MNYYTEEITEVTPALEDFISQCTLLGYKNISSLKDINNIDGFLIGGASQVPNNFIDIIKKTYN